MDPNGGVLKFGRFELDLVRRELRRDGTPVDLQRAPLGLLLYLAAHRDRTVPSRELFRELWPDSTVTDSSLSNAVLQVRRAVGDHGNEQRVIRNLRGRGYRFVADATAAVLPPIRAIAVLPLENLSGDPEQEYVADGMTEALIGELAKIASLRVISRTSVMRYKAPCRPLTEVASELGVEGLLEGSVLREGGRVRINLKLIDGRSDAHLWGMSYERDLRGVLALQSEVAGAVAAQLRVELTPDERSRLGSIRTAKPDAYESYMRAQQLLGAGDVTGIRDWGPSAISHLERAVELDPDFAEAWAVLSASYVLHNLRDFSDRDVAKKGRKAAVRALELDEGLGLAHAALGNVLRFCDWDLRAAGRSYERAVELSPNDVRVHIPYATFLGEVLGKTQEALAVAARLPLLDPFRPQARVWYANAFFWDRQYERALQEYERVRDLAAGFRSDVELVCYVELGRLDEAYLLWIGLLEKEGPRGGPEALQRGWVEGSWCGAVRALIDTLRRRRDVNPTRIALYCSWIGELDEAFSWLERAYRVRDPMLLGLRWPSFDALSSDPRCAQLLRRIGFPEV